MKGKASPSIALPTILKDKRLGSPKISDGPKSDKAMKPITKVIYMM